MARGWESKNIESQQEEAHAPIEAPEIVVAGGAGASSEAAAGSNWREPGP